jgi:hypothetical protein
MKAPCSGTVVEEVTAAAGALDMDAVRRAPAAQEAATTGAVTG